MPCIGLKVLNQNVSMPNDTLGRCVVMLPLPALVLGRRHMAKAKLDLHLRFGDVTSGAIAVSFTYIRHLAPDAAITALNLTIEKVSGGLSTRFKEARLRAKLDREEKEAKSVQLLADRVVQGQLDLEELFKQHGTGGGEGACER